MAQQSLAWAVPNHASKYGGALAAPSVASKDHTAAASVATAVPEAHTPPWSPQNPLFWFGVVAAASIGLMGYSTTVRVGPAKAGVTIGTT
jgi:hypothetical protein